MAPAVVDLTEVVDVEIEQSQGPAVAAGLLQLLFAESEETAAVHQTCDRAEAADPAQFQLPHHQVGHRLQLIELGTLKPARLLIDHAERAEVVAFGRTQGSTRIEADPGLLEHEWIGGEALIRTGVGHHQHLIAGDGMGAEGHLARCFGGIQTMSRQKPLTITINQRHQGDRHVEHGARQLDDPIEMRIGRGVENAMAKQVAQALLLIDGDRVVGEGGHAGVPPPSP